jgi:DNA polymerase III subunit epsilon
MNPLAQFIAFDLETTGLSPLTNEIIEVAGVKFNILFENGVLVSQVVDTFESFARPCMHIPAEATRVNHITDDMVKDAPILTDVLQQFVQFMGLRSILVAHNADFDRKFLRTALVKHQMILPQNPIFDSLKLSRKIMPESPSHKLENLAKRLRRQMNLQVDSTSLHRALYDCQVLREVFTVLLRKRFVEKDLGIQTIVGSIEKVHGPIMTLTV